MSISVRSIETLEGRSSRRGTHSIDGILTGSELELDEVEAVDMNRFDAVVDEVDDSLINDLNQIEAVIFLRKIIDATNSRRRDERKLRR